jgi:hypothetical protein
MAVLPGVRINIMATPISDSSMQQQWSVTDPKLGRQREIALGRLVKKCGPENGR